LSNGKRASPRKCSFRSRWGLQFTLCKIPSVERSPNVDQSITQPLSHCLIFGCLITLEIMYLLIVFLPLLGSSVAGFFGRFLGSEGTAIMTTPEFLLPLFVLVVIFTIIYRILLSKKKKSFLLLFLIYIVVFFLCCLFRFFILEKIVAFLGVTTALSTLILNVSCSGSNSNVHSGGESGEISIPPLESSSRPESSSGSTSLENHASSSEKDYFSPSSQFSSPSTSTSTPAIDSSPNTEQKESLDFLSGELRSFWKTEIIRAVHERLAEIDPQGNIGRIRDGEIVDALRLDSPLRTRQEMEDIFQNVWKRPWPSYEEADRTSIYPRIWDLLEKNKRPDI